MSPRPIEEVSGNNRETEPAPPHSTARNDFTALVDTVRSFVTQGILNSANMTVMDPIDPYATDQIPFLPNFRQILRNATGTDDLSVVTELKLKVVTRDVGIRLLSIYTPNLLELTLDGSVISTLRDLGSAMHSLKVLKINGCKLKSLDGLNGVRNVEKLFAANNKITNLTPCTCLEALRHLDVRNNLLDDWSEISLLSVCDSLKDFVLDENYPLCSDIRYRQKVKGYIPQLVSLDGVDYYEEDNVEIGGLHSNNIPGSSVKLPVVNTNPMDLCGNNNCYSVKFGPNILSPTSAKNIANLERNNESESQDKLPKIQ